MEKKSLYIRRLICTGAILCVFCVFVGVLVKVQLVDGEHGLSADSHHKGDKGRDC